MDSEKNVNRRNFLKKSAVTGAAIATTSMLGTQAVASAAAAEIPSRWDREVDVIVIGTGGAGLAAAITVNDAGSKTIILEKMEKQFEGGNTKVSGNMWWTPTNLPEALQYIETISYGLTDKESIKALAEEMMKLNEWLDSFGFDRKPSGVFQPEHPEIPGSACVRTWSNGTGTGEGRMWIPIRAQVDKRGIEVLYETPAKDLIQAPSREIIGVRAESGGKSIFIKAKKGVILACGGFEFDFEMQKQYLPGWPTYGRGTPGNTGDGIKMAQKAGAALWHMNNSLAGIGCLMVPEYAPVLIPCGLSGSYIYTDKAGQRFMNERRPSRHGFGHKEYLLFFDGIVGEFTRLPCLGIFDESVRVRGSILSGANRKFGWFGWHMGYEPSRDNSKEIEKGWIIKGETVKDLAVKLEIKPEVLEETISKYNQACANQVDADFGRPKDSLSPLQKPPFYAVKLFPATYNTQGGPKRNPKCQVVDPDDKPIPRLYSAGELGSFWGWRYNGGGNNAEAFCTGRIAGRNAAAEKPWS
jgi:succinate dehydrogenase/fumarate reductase flavoprotein subunit